MVCFERNPKTVLAYSAWCRIQDRMAARTHAALLAVGRGFYRVDDLIPQVERHPTLPWRWATGWALHPDARPVPWRRRLGTWRALRHVQELRCRGVTDFCQAMELTRQRYPASSRRPYFTVAATEAWRRAEEFERRGGRGLTPWPILGWTDEHPTTEPARASA